MRVIDPQVPSRLMFWAFVGSTVGLFTASALIVRVLGIPLERSFSTRGQWHIVGVELVSASSGGACCGGTAGRWPASPCL